MSSKILNKYAKDKAELDHQTVIQISEGLKKKFQVPLTPSQKKILQKMFNLFYGVWQDDFMIHDNEEDEDYFIAILVCAGLTDKQLEEVTSHLNLLFTDEYEVAYYGPPLGCDGKSKYFWKVAPPGQHIERRKRRAKKRKS